jgi:hypothetical protein
MRTIGMLLGTFGVGMAVAIAGCATGSEDAAGDESNITPDSKETLFEQAQLCDALVRDKAGVREADLKGGVVRWKCGDVDGVSFDKRPGAGFGQEYCEYHAISGGKVIDDSKRPTGEVLCAFTSVFADSGLDTAALASALKTPLKSQESPPETTAQMQVGFNSRGAATTLVVDCMNAGKSDNFVDAERQTACFQAWKGADEATKKKLMTACKGKDLSKDAAWKKAADLGAKELKPGTPDYEVAEDIAMCTHGLKLGNKIVPWRNSDPTICARAMRASKECGDTFDALPDALPGFAMTSWIDDNDPKSPAQAPVGCKYVSIDDKPFERLLVCTPSAAEVTKAKQAGKVMQQLCKEQFGNLIAMAAPLGAIATPKKSDTQFCKDFHAGVKALK